VGVTLFHTLVRGESPHPAAPRLALGYHMVIGEDFMILSCVVLTQYSSVTDGRTDRRKDVYAVAKSRYSITCCRRSRVKMDASVRHKAL